MNKVVGLFSIVSGFLLFLLLPPYMVTKFGNPWLYFLYFVSWVPGGVFMIMGLMVIGSDKKSN